MGLNMLEIIEEISQSMVNLGHTFDEISRKYQLASKDRDKLIASIRMYLQVSKIHIEAVDRFLSSGEGTFVEIAQVLGSLDEDVKEYETVSNQMKEFYKYVGGRESYVKEFKRGVSNEIEALDRLVYTARFMQKKHRSKPAKKGWL
jgi:septation ring formation regulator EzrA